MNNFLFVVVVGSSNHTNTRRRIPRPKIHRFSFRDATTYQERYGYGRGDRQIDIVIPTYNEEKCIVTCLNSIFDACEYVETTMSTCRVRVTVTDGGSKDDTLKLCEETGRKRDRKEFRVVRQPKNGKRGRGAVLQRAATMLLEEKRKDGRKDDDDLLIFLHADVQIERTFLSNAHMNSLTKVDFKSDSVVWISVNQSGVSSSCVGSQPSIRP